MAVDRFRYLALALDTRMVIDSLIEFIDQGTRKRGFDESLQEVLDSVLAFDKGGLYSQLHSHRLAEYYEQVETLDEVLRPTDRKSLAEKILSIKADNVGLEKQKQDAFEVLELLGQLESRALYNYRPQSA